MNDQSHAVAALFLFSTLAMAGAEAADARSEMLANPCISCHGPDQKSAGSIPALVGMKQEDIAAALKQFKSGERTGTVMNRIAKGYSDEDIEALARYFQQ